MKSPSFRILVIGTIGSGKTTVSTEISRRLNIKHIELDAIYLLQGWKRMPIKDFKDLIDKLTKRESWVVDGNYKMIIDITWRKAEIVVWLDLPFKIIFWRILLRTFFRVVTREKLWNKNIEGFSTLFGPYSRPLWVIKSYWKLKKEYSILLSKLLIFTFLAFTGI